MQVYTMLILLSTLTASNLILYSVLNIDIIDSNNVAYAASLPIRSAEQQFNQIDKSGDSGSVTVISGPMTADGNCEVCQMIKYTPGTKGVAGIAYKSSS